MAKNSERQKQREIRRKVTEGLEQLVDSIDGLTQAEFNDGLTAFLAVNREFAPTRSQMGGGFGGGRGPGVPVLPAGGAPPRPA